MMLTRLGISLAQCAPQPPGDQVHVTDAWNLLSPASKCSGDGGAQLAILLADPQGNQDGAANSEWVLTLRASNALDIHCVGC